MRRLTTPARGAMLVIALGLLGVLWMVVLGFASTSVRSLRLAQRALETERAQWAAESGLHLALQAVAKDATYVPPTSFVPMARSNGSYRVVIYKGTASPVPIPTDHLYLLSTGKDSTGVTRQVAVVAKLGTTRSVISFSIFSEILTMASARIDSFDSTVGPLIRGSLGNVATNSIGPGAVTMSGDSYIKGTIQVGPGGKTGAEQPTASTRGTSHVVWKEPTTYSLREFAANQPVTVPPVAAPPVGTVSPKVGSAGLDLPPGAYLDLSASGGGEVRLTGGTYVFRSINVVGGAKIRFTGTTPATIYVTQGLDMSNGGLDNPTSSPKNMVFMLAKDVTMKMTGGAQAFGVIYGPEANFELGANADIYGAIVAKRVDLKSGSSLHYDVDLAKNPPPVLTSSVTAASGGATAISWQRL